MSPPIVFLHGFLGAPEEWHATLDALELSRECAISLPIETGWNEGISALLDLLPPACHLVGYSLGGRLALGSAVAAPNRIASLVLLSANPGLDESDRNRRGLADRQLARQLESTPTVEFLTKWYDQPLFASVPEATRSDWVEARQNLNRREQARLLESYSVSRQPDYWKQLGELRIPVTYLVGERDKKYRAIAERIKAEAPMVDVNVVESVGHAIHREDHEKAAQVLRRILVDESIEEESDE